MRDHYIEKGKYIEKECIRTRSEFLRNVATTIAMAWGNETKSQTPKLNLEECWFVFIFIFNFKNNTLAKS